MRLVVDTNILFSFFKADSFTKKLINNPNFELISPFFAIKELEKYKEEVKTKCNIKDQEFHKLINELKSKIEFVKEDSYLNFITEAIKVSPDKADSNFIALSIKNSCPLWTNDKELTKQSKVRILTTEDIVNLML